MVGIDLTYKIVLIGEASEGKSYFARNFCYDLFNNETKLTIGVDIFVRTQNILGKIIKFQIWDVGSEKRFRFLAPYYCRGASGGLIVYDVNDANSLAHILENIQLIRIEAGNIPIIIIGIKCVDNNLEDPIGKETQQNRLENLHTAENIFENLAESIVKGISPNIFVVPKPLDIRRKPYSETWPEFRVNNHLVLRLENNRTNIYVGGKLFTHCKYLLLSIDKDKFNEYDEIESIDEAAETLDDSMHGVRFGKYDISPETEFWGHCSNIQAWYESKYDTRLLHRNLAFPLLKTLIKVGDPIAKRVIKEEIAERLESGYPSVVLFLINENYLDFLNQQELNTIFENPKFQKNLSNWFNDTNIIPKWLSNKIKFKLEAFDLWR